MLRDISSLSDSEITSLIEFLSSFRSKERVEQLWKVLNKRTRYLTALLENIDKGKPQLLTKFPFEKGVYLMKF